MPKIVDQAVDDVSKSKVAFCKFISANEVGVTGSNQSGFYIPRGAYRILFDVPGLKGENKDRLVTINWQGGFKTDSRFVYYGSGTRNEYRITRFGRGFPFLQDDNIGDLFVLVQLDAQDYAAYVLSTDEDIEYFLSVFGMSPSDTNRLIDISNRKNNEFVMDSIFSEYIIGLDVDFPSTIEISSAARNFVQRLQNIDIERNPDQCLIEWMEIEYKLFKAIESDRYQGRISTPFTSVEELIDCANTLLNRRKSRAGKSLEHHLFEVFSKRGLTFGYQIRTEGNKKPDFIFPGYEEYQSALYDSNKLVYLGAKTTCKDRWRQILNEADRISTKHLFTLQQGISVNQLQEMYQNGVVLVVPKSYKSSFPGSFREKILTLESFISYVQENQ